MYSLDSSFFMDWQARYYPLDLFPTLEENFVRMIVAGTCGAIELVREEIDAVGTPGLRTWVSNQSGLFLPMTPEIQIEAAAIEAAYPELMDPKSLNESADAYVIALGKNKGLGCCLSGNIRSRKTPTTAELFHSRRVQGPGHPMR